MSSVYKVPAKDSYSSGESSEYKVPIKDSYSSGISSSYVLPQKETYSVSSSYKVPPSKDIFANGGYISESEYPKDVYQVPSTKYKDSHIVKYERDVANKEVAKPLFYGDTFDQVSLYRDPYKYSSSGYNIYSPVRTTAGPANRFSSDTAINSPIVTFRGEPMLQAVKNPFVEDVHHDDHVKQEDIELVYEEEVEEEPVPDAEPVIDSIIVHDSLKKLAALKEDEDHDIDDPFEPEAEVDIQQDFLPSINPLAPKNILFPISSSLPVHSISQSLELLPESFLEQIRQQREFEDSIADLREIDDDVDHKQRKRDHLASIDNPETRELIYSDASFNKDKIHAYNIYRNQWTTSGNKKLVVDASKALQKYYKERDDVGDTQISYFNNFDIDNYLQTDRDTGTHTQVICLETRNNATMYGIGCYNLN